MSIKPTQFANSPYLKMTLRQQAALFFNTAEENLSEAQMKEFEEMYRNWVDKGMSFYQKLKDAKETTSIQNTTSYFSQTSKTLTPTARVIAESLTSKHLDALNQGAPLLTKEQHMTAMTSNFSQVSSDVDLMILFEEAFPHWVKQSNYNEESFDFLTTRLYLQLEDTNLEDSVAFKLISKIPADYEQGLLDYVFGTNLAPPENLKLLLNTAAAKAVALLLYNEPYFWDIVSIGVRNLRSPITLNFGGETYPCDLTHITGTFQLTSRFLFSHLEDFDMIYTPFRISKDDVLLVSNGTLIYKFYTQIFKQLEGDV